MCGICGVYGLEDEKLIKRMNEQLVHRGPDDSGIYSDKNIMLGHRRLSIIDLFSGRQPIHNEDESIWIVYNGEIYNYKDIKEELEQKGHRFYTNTDTEVIIHSYEEYGEECVKKFNGAFAFAIWDQNKRKLFLARDRLGIKPLYYLWNGEILLFASEIKSILQYEGYKPEVDLNAMHNFLVFRYNNSIQTLFKRIKKLPPAHSMTIQTGKANLKRYWSLQVSELSKKSKEEYIKELSRLLADSVERRLMSDVPLGAYLSGGLDSSSVVGVMCKFIEEPKTFSIGFGEYGESEIEFAKIIADHFGTDHHEIIVEPDVIEFLPKIIWHLDEPMSDLATLPVFIMSQEAKKDVSVILTGDGNDEIWAGYPRYHIQLKRERMRRLIPLFFRQKIIPKVIDHFPESRMRSIFNDIKDTLIDSETYYKKGGVFDDRERHSMYNEMLNQKIEIMSPKQVISQRYFQDNWSLLNKLLLIDVNTLLPNSFLVKVDRMTMAHGVEARVPLIDHRIVELSFTVPPELKLHGSSEKYLFKEAMNDILPKEIIKRKKHGFGVPIDMWMKELKELAEQILDGKTTQNRGYFKAEFIKNVLKDINSPTHSQAQRLWSLITLELWHRIFIDGIANVNSINLNMDKIIYGRD